MTHDRPQDLHPIQLRIQDLAQLFHTLDPFPFRERDLDATVEEYVVGWAGELPTSQPIAIMVHLPKAQADREEAQHIGDAIRRYFAYRADAVGWELRDLFRNGRSALAIGLAVLAACIIAGKAGEDVLPPGYLHRFFNEALIILGSVANWRPLEIFLYDWWPIVRRRRLYRRLALASVQLVGDA
jgi:hypothetical protein